MDNKIQLALQTEFARKFTMQKNKNLSSTTNGSAHSAATDRTFGSTKDPYEKEALDLDWSGELT